MKFHYKANYDGDYDGKGIPLLNYHGIIGKQYNPIAIAQYGLGNLNLYLESDDTSKLDKFYLVADWLVQNLEKNKKNVFVWNHYFDFEYRDTLVSPWYAGLAQGMGISLLARAYKLSGNQKYIECIKKAWISFTKTVDEGGVIYIDKEKNYWIEEYIVDPPTHILNGFIWAMWGVYDAWKILNLDGAEDLFNKTCKTLKNNITKYDFNYWSLYEDSGTKMKMIASSFYHSLHIVQLKIMYKITKDIAYLDMAQQWELYKLSFFKRSRALAYKIVFKIFYY